VFSGQSKVPFVSESIILVSFLSQLEIHFLRTKLPETRSAKIWQTLERMIETRFDGLPLNPVAQIEFLCQA
jgi:hypothetical protein